MNESRHWFLYWSRLTVISIDLNPLSKEAASELTCHKTHSGGGGGGGDVCFAVYCTVISFAIFTVMSIARVYVLKNIVYNLTTAFSICS